MPSRLSTLDKEVPLLSYWEDDPPSRMDFGKIKYGGPFTTEQVEDVKTFIKILGLTLIASLLGSTVFNSDFYTIYLTNNYSTENIFYSCFRKDFLTNISTIIGLILHGRTVERISSLSSLLPMYSN